MCLFILINLGIGFHSQWHKSRIPNQIRRKDKILYTPVKNLLRSMILRL